jgi:hypothetical protein
MSGCGNACERVAYSTFHKWLLRADVPEPLAMVTINTTYSWILSLSRGLDLLEVDAQKHPSRLVEAVIGLKRRALDVPDPLKTSPSSFVLMSEQNSRMRAQYQRCRVSGATGANDLHAHPSRTEQ